MKPTTLILQLQSFLSMTNQFGNFVPNLVHLTQPLRELLSKTRACLWGPEQDSAFSRVKAKLTSQQHCHSMIHRPLQRYQWMTRSLAWEQSSYNNLSHSGSQWHMYNGHCQRQNNSTPKLRNRLLPSLALVRNSLTTSWERRSPLRPITSP